MPKTNIFPQGNFASLGFMGGELLSPEVNLDTTQTPGINLGNFDLGSMASIAGVIGGFIAAKDDKKFKNEMLKREDDRIARERKRQDSFDAGMKEAWGIK